MKHIKNTVMDVTDIHEFPSMNVARNHGDLFLDDADRARIFKLMFRGWNFQQEVIVVRKMTPDEKKKAIEERQAYFQMLKEGGPLDNVLVELNGETKRGNVTPSERMRAYQETYLAAKPDYCRVTGFRRGAVMPDVFAAQLAFGMDYTRQIAVAIYEFENMTEQARINIEENERKGEGALEPSWRQKVASSREMYEAGANQSMLRQIYLPGNGQKLWWILETNRMFPDLDVVGRILRSEIHVPSIRWQNLKEGCETNDAEKLGAYLKKPKEGNRPAVADRKLHESLSKQSPAKMVQYFATHHLTDSLQEAVKPINARSVVLNTLWDLLLGLSDADYAKLEANVDKIQPAIVNLIA